MIKTLFKIFVSIELILIPLCLFGDNESDFFNVAKNGDIQAISAYIKKGVDLNKKDNDGFTILMFAARYNKSDIVKLLIESKADLNLMNNIGMTALMIASEMGYTNIVKLLLDAKADIEAKDNNKYQKTNIYGKTALMYAAESGGIDTVKLLVNAKADVNAKTYQNETALMCAARYNQTELMKFLIEAKADVNAKDNAGNTALMIAADSGYLNVVKLLIESKADVNAKNYNGQTALMLAAQKGKTDIVKLLIEAKADINTKNYNWSALMLAIYNNHTDAADILKKNGAKEDIIEAVMSGDVDFINSFINNGGNINTKDKNNWTLLMYVAKYNLNNSINSINALLAANVFINEKDNQGKTALIIAAEAENSDVVKLLIKAKADIGVVDLNGMNALNYAKMYNNNEIITELKNAGAKE